jgi:hypothetical protein
MKDIIFIIVTLAFFAIALATYDSVIGFAEVKSL